MVGAPSTKSQSCHVCGAEPRPRMRLLVRELKCDDGGDRAEEVIASGIGGSGSPCDLFGRDRIAGRDGLLDGFVDQLLLTLVQIVIWRAVAGRIPRREIGVDLPGGALLITARWSGTRHGSVLRLRPQRGCWAGCWPLGLTGAPTVRPEPPLADDHVLEDERKRR